MRRLVRTVGFLLVAVGAAIVLWAITVWQWKDPFTSLYTWREQSRLSERYDEQAARFASGRLALGRDGALAAVAAESRRYRRALERGQPVGRIDIPRLGLDLVVVNGTDPETLRKGPGRDRRSLLPGERGLVYVAGHRTTYGAPFADIDLLRPGDRVTLELPYASFDYRITGHTIVAAEDLSPLRPRPRELLALQACHPRFFASRRYIAYAAPVRLRVGGRTYALAS